MMLFLRLGGSGGWSPPPAVGARLRGERVLGKLAISHPKLQVGLQIENLESKRRHGASGTPRAQCTSCGCRTGGCRTATTQWGRCMPRCRWPLTASLPATSAQHDPQFCMIKMWEVQRTYCKSWRPHSANSPPSPRFSKVRQRATWASSQ